MTYEDDDLDDTVDELRWEVSLDSAHDELSCLRSYRTFTHVVEVAAPRFNVIMITVFLKSTTRP